MACIGLSIVLFGSRPDQSLPKGRVVVDYWEKWTGVEASQMSRIVQTFNDTVGAEKGIYVRFVSTSDINQKTLVSTAAGVPPDIAGMTGTELAQFAALDALEPLEDRAAAWGISASTYKPVYWNGCHYDGHLYALISTPWALAMFYNKQTFQENAAQLRAAGLDPNRAPATIDELDAYAKVLTSFDASHQLRRAGFLPSDSWFPDMTCLWFGGNLWDDRTHRFTLTDPAVVRSYEWMASYSRWLGVEDLNHFTKSEGTFDSPANPFLAGTEVIVQQGPWMANFITNNKPDMSQLLWPRSIEMTKSPQERVRNYAWAAAPFPSAVPGMQNVTYCGFDILVIPRGARHPDEAFAFMAWLNQQKIMEQLCAMHCKNSPLAQVSDEFIRNHPNPYISVFEALSRSPNAHGPPQIPINAEVFDELNNVHDRIIRLETEPAAALAAAQTLLQGKYDHFMDLQRQRHAAGSNEMGD